MASLLHAAYRLLRHETETRRPEHFAHCVALEPRRARYLRHGKGFLVSLSHGRAIC